jgi:ribosomal protein S12 methylthiotransferase accessory factor YcaO
VYTTLDRQAATPLQVPVAVVVVGEAAPLVVVDGAGCVDDPAQALTAIL